MSISSLVSNYDQILEFAKQMSIPLIKSRAIIREYLQSLTISTLYAQPKSDKLSFVGGTSLRLLRNIDRFSEDLDFDNLGLSDAEIDSMIEAVVNRFFRQNVAVEKFVKHSEGKNYYELRFSDLLYDLDISTNPREKLMIKIDYASYWTGQEPESILFSKYGILERVITNPRNQLLVQKLGAYTQRKQTQPRDIYDIVWLYSQGARFDKIFAHKNNLESVVQDALQKLNTEPISNTLKQRLQPFLFEEGSIQRLDLFKDVLQSLSKD